MSPLASGEADPAWAQLHVLHLDANAKRDHAATGQVDGDDDDDVQLEWMPSYKAYRLRCLRQLKAKGRLMTLPDGFPEKIDSPLAWEASDVKQDDYIVRLTAKDVEEVEAALVSFKGLGLPISSVGTETFALPTLGPRLAEVRSRLYHGRGFFIVRGLDPRDYTAHDNVVVYVGISSYIAAHRGRQDEHNNYLLHLIDLGADVAPDHVRQAPYSNVAQPYHTDTGDILALYALETAFSGGRSKLASSAKIYNDLARTRPDHIHTLCGLWPFDSFNPNEVPAYRNRPLLFHEDNKTILSFSRRPLTGSKVSPRTPGIPRLTAAQAEALDAIHFAAERNSLAIDLQRGDMQFWNNLSLVHGREGFEDMPDQKRHLLRLWLRDDKEAWAIPDALQDAWHMAYGDDERAEKWPVEPIADYAHVTTQRRSSGYA